jgi:hypothetical protein
MVALRPSIDDVLDGISPPGELGWDAPEALTPRQRVITDLLGLLILLCTLVAYLLFA